LRYDHTQVSAILTGEAAVVEDNNSAAAADMAVVVAAAAVGKSLAGTDNTDSAPVAGLANSLYWGSDTGRVYPAAAAAAIAAASWSGPARSRPDAADDPGAADTEA
jgi:hypothetical protein